MLRHVKDSTGAPLVRGKRVTGFSNTEEAAVGLTDVVPFLLEEMLRGNGGDYRRSEDWNSHVERDGLLITGPVTGNMKLGLQKTYDALAEPRIVIALGACAISGGLYAGHPEVHSGASSVVPVAVVLPQKMAAAEPEQIGRGQ